MSSWNDIVGSVPAGNYEYIDIVCESTQNRLIVDINFKSNFEIARASKHYTALLEMVPHIFIGRPERLHLMLKIMCKAAKLSLKLMGMYLPPWRKYSYLQAKWFSPHLRVTSPQKIDLPPPSPSSVVPNFPGTEDDELDELKLRVKQSFSSAIASKKHMTTMYITDWKLPAASPCRLTSSRKRVSALANALKERNQATSSRDKSACLAIKWNSAAMAC
ncbi:hypothetical protein KP509_27G003000 [Ceratopteris richardii]|nr:hypothetical protein KP509_27G003000 [Ceratopteris richardii]